MDIEAAPRRQWLSPALFALPGIALAAVGLTHPHHLTADTASYWWRMHVGLIPVFPLLGLALAGLMGRRNDLTAWAVRILAYGYAIGYTALDMLSGVATGYSVDPAVSVGDGPAPAAIPRLYAIGNELGTLGARAFLLAAAAVAADAVLRLGVRSLPPSLLLVVASVSFLDSHIYRWRGVITVALIGVALGWLRWLQGRTSPRRRSMKRLLAAVIPALLVAACGRSGAELRIVSEDGAGGSSEGMVVQPGQTHWTYGLGGLCVSEPATAVARLTLVDSVGMIVDAIGTRSGPVDVFGSPVSLAQVGVTSSPNNDATISTPCVFDPNDTAGFTGIYLQVSKAPGRASFSAITIDWESGDRSGTLNIPFELVLCDAEPCV